MVSKLAQSLLVRVRDLRGVFKVKCEWDASGSGRGFTEIHEGSFESPESNEQIETLKTTGGCTEDFKRYIPPLTHSSLLWWSCRSKF